MAFVFLLLPQINSFASLHIMLSAIQIRNDSSVNSRFSMLINGDLA